MNRSWNTTRKIYTIQQSLQTFLLNGLAITWEVINMNSYTGEPYTQN